MVEVDEGGLAVTPEESAAVAGLLSSDVPMTPEEAAIVLACPVCRGPVVPRNKPWLFRCPACPVSFKPPDIGELQAAVRRRVAAALAARVGAAEGMTD